MYKMHNFIDSTHLYETKPETWFKFWGFAISWFGGFYWLAPHIDATQYGVAFFIYSIALFMEFFMKLTSSTKFPAKIYPFLIILCGTAILLDSISQWNQQGRGFLQIDMLNAIAFIPVIILFVDTFSITMIEKRVSVIKPEDNLFTGGS